MRQGQQQQQNRRGRGRNNNRKGQNPLARSFESNGPDVKIRGTPAHIAEKYMALARDSMSAGDPVLAENYLQHAEHYNRIIMAYREQQSPSGNDIVNNGSNRFRSPAQDHYDGDDISDDDNEELAAESHQPIIHPNDPQPIIPVARHERPEGNERRERNDRPERGERPERQERPERSDRVERAERSERSAERADDARPSRDRRVNGAASQRQRAEGAAKAERSEPRRRERQRFGESDEQPDFLRRPVRRTRRDEGEAEEDAVQPQPQSQQAQPQSEAVVEENQD